MPDQPFDRNCGVGASEWAAALGFSPYQTSRQLAMIKRGLVAPAEPNDAMRRGLEFEPLIAAYWAKRHAEAVVSLHQQVVMHPGLPYLYATPDYRITFEDGTTALMECKCHTERVRGQYGDPMTSAVPATIWLQCQGQMACTGEEQVMVVPWFGTKDRDEHWVVHRDENVDLTAQLVSDWYARYVLGDELPDSHEGDIADLSKTIPPSEHVTMQADSTLVSRIADLMLLSAQAKTIEGRIGALKATIMDAMEDADADGVDSPHGLITWRGQSRKSTKVDTKLLQDRFPDAYAACATETTTSFRVLRTPKWEDTE